VEATALGPPEVALSDEQKLLCERELYEAAAMALPEGGDGEL
jgi:hypothetical protein